MFRPWFPFTRVLLGALVGVELREDFVEAGAGAGETLRSVVA